MNKKRASEFFIGTLSELSLSRMTISSLIKQILLMRGLPRAVYSITNEISSLLEQGHALSASFSMCKNADFSEQDISLISCAEETGNYGDTFKFLSSIYAKKKETRSKLTLCAIYPTFVILLAAGATGALMFFAETLFPFSKDMLRDEAFMFTMRRGIIAACLFLACAIFCCVFVSLKLIQYPPQYYVFSLLEFLTHAGFDVYRAMDPAINAAIRNQKLCASLTRVKEAMRTGDSMASAFACEKIFGSLIFLIETASINGTADNIFFLAAKKIEKTREYHEQLFLRTVEPAMLLCAGIYMLLLMRCTVIPLMMNYGGLL